MADSVYDDNPHFGHEPQINSLSLEPFWGEDSLEDECMSDIVVRRMKYSDQQVLLDEEQIRRGKTIEERKSLTIAIVKNAMSNYMMRNKVIYLEPKGDDYSALNKGIASGKPLQKALQ